MRSSSEDSSVYSFWMLLAEVCRRVDEKSNLCEKENRTSRGVVF